MRKQEQTHKDNSNKKVALTVFSGALLMLGAAYAAVPLYQLFCQVTGYGGTTQRAGVAPEKTLDRTITVRFDSNVSKDLDWKFKPVDRSIKIKLGETKQVSYMAQNIGTAPSAGTATFNVSPASAGAYFNKMECFCFTEQTLQKGEKIDMPVVFFIDPDYATDPDINAVDTITLSYTFYPDENAQTASNTLAQTDEKAQKQL